MGLLGAGRGSARGNVLGRPLTKEALLQVCDGRSYKSKEPHESVGGSPQREASPGPGAKEAGQGKDVLEEEAPDELEGVEATPGPPGRGAVPGPGEVLPARPPCRPQFPCPP